MTRLSTVTASVLLGFCAAAASVHAGQISPDIVRPSAVVLDPRAYVSAFFQANTTEGETQLLQFYSYVPQWWSVWGQPVPLHFVIPAYFGDQFRYPYAAGSDPTKPIGFYIIDQMSALANGTMVSITTSANTAAGLLSDTVVDLCNYAAQYNMPCNMRVEVADIDFDNGTFYGLGFQYFQNTMLNTTSMIRKALSNPNLFQGYVIHDLQSMALMTTSPTGTFANAFVYVTPWMADSTMIQYYGLNATNSVFQFTSTLGNLARIRVNKMQIDATTMITAAPQNLQQFVNVAAYNNNPTEIYLGSSEWGLTNYNGYYNAYTTLGQVVSLIYSGNQTYPAATGPLSTMPPIPSTAVPTFGLTSTPTEQITNNQPTIAGDNGGATGTQAAGPNTNQNSSAPSPVPLSALSIALAGIASALFAVLSI